MQKKLEAFFSKYGKTNAVRMRRLEETKEFKVGIRTFAFAKSRAAC